MFRLRSLSLSLSFATVPYLFEANWFLSKQSVRLFSYLYASSTRFVLTFLEEISNIVIVPNLMLAWRNFALWQLSPLCLLYTHTHINDSIGVHKKRNVTESCHMYNNLRRTKLNISISFVHSNCNLFLNSSWLKSFTSRAHTNTRKTHF